MMDVGCGRLDPIAIHTVLLAQRSHPGTRLEDGVDFLGGSSQLVRQGGKVAYRDIRPARNCDSVLSGRNRPPHPVPSVLDQPPAWRSDCGSGDRARCPKAVTRSQVKHPDAP